MRSLPESVTSTWSTPASSPRPLHDLDAFLGQSLGDVGGLVGGQLLDASVDLAEVDRDGRRLVALVVGESYAELLGLATSVIRSDVAIRVLLGTQSVSTAEPPMPSLSTTVTCEPS